MVLEEEGAETQGKPIEILFEDPRIVVLSKPSGVPVVPDRSRGVESCLGFLVRRELRSRREKLPGEFCRPRTVHRIDRLTSGLVLFAKTAEDERQLGGAFETREVEKEYLALLGGVVEPARFTVNCPISTGRKGRMLASPLGAGGRTSGKAALTRFDVLERFHDSTWVVARPRTGRTHQIRLHAWASGHPLAVDPLYAASSVGDGLGLPWAPDRLTLHAFRYTLPKRWGTPRVFECPLPADLERALDRLRRTRDS
jgi:23S rRNA pseudouridine1911/1915/1917 synthase